MTSKHPHCVAIEPDLVAAATGEAGPAASERVGEHVARCVTCREDFHRYRAIEAATGQMRREPMADDESGARARLVSRLADLRRRLLTYRVFESPLGHILIARSEEGVALVEYLGDAATVRASRLTRMAEGVELVEDGGRIEGLYRELIEFLEGRRVKLEWPLDLRLARGDFDRTVLHVTASIPYGAVTSYAAVAREIGKPSAFRAVAQALRWNPLPLVIPCHRVIGSSGALTGYAGNQISMKQRLLSLEGLPIVRAPHDFQISRQATYACDRGDREYCLPTCGSIARRSLAGLTLFASRARAEAAGLTPCTTCRPDLHPLER